MTARAWWIVVMTGVAAVVVLPIVFSSGVAQDKDKARARITWEYKVVKGELDEKKLNDLGEQGWELVQLTGGKPYVASSVATPEYAKPEPVPVGVVRLPREVVKTTTTNTVAYAPFVYHFKRLK